MATYLPPRYVNNDEKVLIPWPTKEKPRQGAWVTVVQAMGNTARVVNEKLGVDRWYKLDDLLVPSDDPRA